MVEKMYIKDILKPENVEIIESVTDWKDAIIKGTRKLIEGGFITYEYTEAIIANALKFNAYFVLCPGIALLHASSNDGVNETQLSLTYVKEPFRFEGKEEDVNLLIGMAASEGNDHMEAIKQIAIILSDNENMKKALNPQTAEELYDLFTSIDIL